MDTLHKMFTEELQKYSYSFVGTKIIKRELEKKGISLDQNQIDRLLKVLQDYRGNISNFDFDFNDDQINILGVSDSKVAEIDINPSAQELDEIYEEFDIQVKESIPEIINETTSQLLSFLKKDAPIMLKKRRKDMKGFEKRLNTDWKKPFDLYEMFLAIAYEAGDEFNNEFRKDESDRKNYLLQVLTRLHARACQIASEILVLLKSGYADGALARWRSLHEIAVVGSFIKSHGNEIAERYLLHDNIESFRAANLFQKYCEALGFSPIPQEEYDSIKSDYENLINRFGKSYKNNYGWASSVLSKEDPNFSDIEESSRLDHYHPYYKLASHNVHANPKGILFKIGLLPDTLDILLAGPSNCGFTDPGQFAAISLGIITITLITSEPNLDNLVLSNILFKLQSEIAEEFFKAQKVIEERNAALQPV